MRRPGGGTILAGFAVLAVVAAVAGGLLVLGPPSEERARRMDDRRIAHLRGIESAVAIFVEREIRLPVSLDELAGKEWMRVEVRDPGTGQAYEYHALGERRYELCATFERESRGSDTTPWFHRAGRQCFPFETEEQKPVASH